MVHNIKKISYYKKKNNKWDAEHLIENSCSTDSELVAQTILEQVLWRTGPEAATTSCSCLVKGEAMVAEGDRVARYDGTCTVGW